DRSPPASRWTRRAETRPGRPGGPPQRLARVRGSGRVERRLRRGHDRPACAIPRGPLIRGDELVRAVLGRDGTQRLVLRPRVRLRRDPPRTAPAQARPMRLQIPRKAETMNEGSRTQIDPPRAGVLSEETRDELARIARNSRQEGTGRLAS